jgi:hypothetical protein
MSGGGNAETSIGQPLFLAAAPFDTETASAAPPQGWPGAANYDGSSPHYCRIPSIFLNGQIVNQDQRRTVTDHPALND